MPERAIVIAELERHGTKLQELNQRARREAHVAPGQGVDQGFCTGFCFDWIRKVILGGENRATYVPKATKTAEQKEDTERRQTLRAATVHVNKTAYRDNDVANFGTARTDANNLGSLIQTLQDNYNPNRDQPNLRLRFGPETMEALRQHFVLDSDTLSFSTILDLINRLRQTHQTDLNDLQRRRLELTGSLISRSPGARSRRLWIAVLRRKERRPARPAGRPGHSVQSKLQLRPHHSTT